MPNYLDMMGFPESGFPLLQNVKGVVLIDKMNPALGTGFLKHTTGTGALSVQNVVTAMHSGDSFISYSPNTGDAYSYFNTSALDATHVPYYNATADVNLGIWGVVSSNYGVTSFDSMSPYSTSFYTNYPDLALYQASGYSSGAGDYLYDYYGDGILYDSIYSPQATIDYVTGYIDTSSYNSWVIDSFGYYYNPIPYTTFIGYNGSGFNNGITVSRDQNSYAGYFYDNAGSVALCDGTYALIVGGSTYLNGLIYTPNMPTSDPADGTFTLWYDATTNAVYRGT